MAKVIVQTDDGREVWSLDEIESWHVDSLTCPTNTRGSAVAAGIRRAVTDAEAIQEGRDPRRLSEIAIELAEYVREGTLYTYRHGKGDVLLIDESRHGVAFREVYPHRSSEIRTMTKARFEQTFRKVEAEQPVASGG